MTHTSTEQERDLKDIEQALRLVREAHQHEVDAYRPELYKPECDRRPKPQLDRLGDLICLLQNILYAAQQASRRAQVVPKWWKLVPIKVPDSAFAWVSGGYPAGFKAGDKRDTAVVHERAQRTWEAILNGITAPAHPAEGVPTQAEALRAELAEATEAADNWRRLALQFDNHRMQALGHLRELVRIDDGYAEAQSAEQFLAAPPLDGEAVLAQRIAALAAAQPAAQGIDGREFPPLTPELASILGLMCFECISFAQALRAAGHTIKTRAEDEQAAVLHWMLGHYFHHGDDWRTAAGEDMKRMEAEALAAQAKQGGAA